MSLKTLRRNSSRSPRLYASSVLPRAFTLVELLVVIGIIVVLAGLLLPSLATARDSAKATTCLGNIRQISLAFTTYAMDNQGYTPYQSNQDVDDFANPAVYHNGNINDVSCLGLLIRYVGGTTAIYVCPVATDTTWTSGQEQTVFSDTNYMANQVTLGRPLTRIRNAAEVAFLQEDRFRWQAAWLRPCQNGGVANTSSATYCAWCFDNGTQWGQEYSYLHRRGGNLAFVDGHAEWRAASEIHPSTFGLAGIPGTSNSNDPDTVSQGQTYIGAVN
jgi:prepilin-type N-terminal cleavage/methylation domain-containing protein/prepilin-type processing-associated H-X9-DG protein